jgi:type IV pilus assembly protein PilE
MKHQQHGFTLIELMITIAVLGVLVAVALPSYREATRKAHRADAKISLSRLATIEEKHYFRENKYTGDFADMITGAAVGTTTVVSDEGYYSIALTVSGGGTGWSMTATAAGDQAGDTNCTTFTLTSLGAKTAADSASAATTDCW